MWDIVIFRNKQNALILLFLRYLYDIFIRHLSIDLYKVSSYSTVSIQSYIYTSWQFSLVVNKKAIFALTYTAFSIHICATLNTIKSYDIYTRYLVLPSISLQKLFSLAHEFFSFVNIYIK